MYILLIAPNTTTIPPYDGYGGTERVIFDFALQASRKGHKVDILCKAGSTINERNIRPIPFDANQHGDDYLGFVRSFLEEHHTVYDVVNLHVFKPHFVREVSRVPVPVATSLHFYVDAEKIRPFEELNSFYLAQSESQAAFYRQFLGDKVKGILQGIRTEHVPYSYKSFGDVSQSDLRLDLHHKLKALGVNNYLLILSKISQRKGQLTAIRLCQDLGLPLVIAGEPMDDYKGAREHSIDYFENKIQPLIDNKNVIYFGNANEVEKYELMRYAQTTILPTGFEDNWWKEAFGRVVAESLVTGTPVVAYRNGAMEEQIIEGENGYLFDSYSEALDQIRKSGSLSRKFCRQDALKRLSSNRFAIDCLTYFSEIIQNSTSTRKLQPISS